MDADYIVVGTGSAGSVVANRLSADPSVEVVVLEAGPRDKDKFIHIPAGFAKLFRSEMDWDYLTEPQKELDGREIYWPRGKVLGGSSSMNAMMWVRGFAADYDEWAEHAGEQWSYANVEGYFNRIENGPLVISPQRSPRSSTAAWLTAAQECIDMPEGFCETRVTQRKGARWSTADAYLKPALRRRNLTLQTGATATRVIFDGKRATGVEFEQLGARRVVTARREVVLCGGAINSPQLLMLSGIGDRGHLAEHGIDMVQEAPDVGNNLLDHLMVPIGFDVPDDTLFAAEKPMQLVNYFVRRRGMLTSNVGEAYGFVRSRPELELPDLELIFAPAPYFEEGIGDPYDRHAVVMGADTAEAVQPRHHHPAVGRPEGQAGHRSEVSDRRRGCRSCGADGGPADVRGHRQIACAQRHHRQDRQAARRNRSRRRNTRAGTELVVAHALSSGQHVPDGQRRRQRRRPGAAGARRGRAACRRRIGDAERSSAATPTRPAC